MCGGDGSRYLGLFWKRKPHFMVKLHETICFNMRRISSHLITELILYRRSELEMKSCLNNL